MISINSEKIKYTLTNITQISMMDIINGYYNYIDCNNFDDLECPCCKHKSTLTFHKRYSRNITYIENELVVDTTIDIAVVLCSYCKSKGNKQKYHALLPFFILPYHIYESSVIINSLYKYLNNIKLQQILERINITHKLFYDWLKKFNKYLLSSSIILNENNVINNVINKIYKLKENFLIDFYHNYNHPFYLFKNTCVPLSITP